MHHHLQKCSPTTGNYTKSLGKTLPSNPVRRLPRPTTALAAPWIDPHEIAVCASTTRRRAWTQGNGKSLFGGPFSSFESSRWINTMVAADFPGSPLDERPGYQRWATKWDEQWCRHHQQRPWTRPWSQEVAIDCVNGAIEHRN